MAGAGTKRIIRWRIATLGGNCTISIIYLLPFSDPLVDISKQPVDLDNHTLYTGKYNQASSAERWSMGWRLSRLKSRARYSRPSPLAFETAWVRLRTSSFR